MKTYINCFLISLILSLLVSNLAAQTSQERTVDPFTKIDLRVAGDVYLTQSDEQKVVVEADEDVLEKLKTEVVNGTLIIKFDVWKIKYSKLTVRISVKVIEELEVSGSGSIIAESTISTKDLDLDISGSGEIKIEDLEATDIEANISGSGEIILGGKSVVNSLDFDISGSGDIKAYEL